MIPYMKYHSKGDVHWQWYQDTSHTYRHLVDAALEPFKSVPRGSLVDIGAGDGLPISLLSHLGFQCLGLEPIKKGVELAALHEVDAEFLIDKAENFAKMGAEFDYLLSINTIEHLDNAACMRDIMKGIRQFGVIVTDNKDTKNRDSIFHTKEFNKEEFCQLFSGFELIELPMPLSPAFFGYIIKNIK